jgi:hypothetical protein
MLALGLAVPITGSTVDVLVSCLQTTTQHTRVRKMLANRSPHKNGIYASPFTDTFTDTFIDTFTATSTTHTFSDVTSAKLHYQHHAEISAM